MNKHIYVHYCTPYTHAQHMPHALLPWRTHIYQNIAYIYLLLKIQTNNLRLKHWGIETTNCTIRYLRSWQYNIHPLVQLVLTFIYTVNILFIPTFLVLHFYNFVCICAVGFGIYSIRFHRIIFLILYNSTLHAHIGKEINLLF